MIRTSRSFHTFACAFGLALATLAAAPISVAQSSATLAPAPSYTPSLVLTPRVGQGLGTVSPYAGVATTLAPDATGTEVITLPAADKREVNLVWTFWSHRQPTSDAWPAGQAARTELTLRATSDITLSPRVGVRAIEWTKMVPAPDVVLKAGEAVTVVIPLPDSLPAGAVETIRIQFTARENIPELRVTAWSVGTQKE